MEAKKTSSKCRVICYYFTLDSFSTYKVPPQGVSLSFLPGRLHSTRLDGYCPYRLAVSLNC